jgi:hypothetical protein
LPDHNLTEAAIDFKRSDFYPAGASILVAWRRMTPEFFRELGTFCAGFGVQSASGGSGFLRNEYWRGTTSVNTGIPDKE